MLRKEVKDTRHTYNAKQTKNLKSHTKNDRNGIK